MSGIRQDMDCGVRQGGIRGRIQSRLRGRIQGGLRGRIYKLWHETLRGEMRRRAACEWQARGRSTWREGSAGRRWVAPLRSARALAWRAPRSEVCKVRVKSCPAVLPAKIAWQILVAHAVSCGTHPVALCARGRARASILGEARAGVRVCARGACVGCMASEGWATGRAGRASAVSWISPALSPPRSDVR